MSRKGKLFYGCDQFPSCKFASWDKPVQKTCPQCEAPLMYERGARSSSTALVCRVCELTLEAEAPEPAPDESKDAA